MKPSVLSAIIVSVIVAIGAVLYFASGSEDTNETSNTAETTQQQTTETQEPAAQLSEYSLMDVAAHSTVDDCWTIVDGNVYDISDYVNRHPGGLDEILLACGQDGTSLFNQRQTSDGEQIGSGTPHSSRAASQLSAYQIGTLVN